MSKGSDIELAHRFLQSGELVKAMSACALILEKNPSHAQALQVAALVRQQQGSFEDAERFYVEALRAAPTNPEINFNYGNFLMQVGRPNDAVRAYRVTVSQVADDPLPLCNLGAALGSIGRISESVAMLRRALELDPSTAEARQSLASNLMLSGLSELAVPEFEQAISSKSGSYSNAEIGLLFSLTTSPRWSRDHVWRAHRDWGAKIAAALPAYSRNFAVSKETDRPLRVGFVSADFKEHSVAAFLEPLLEATNRKDLDYFAYSETLSPDAVTLRLKDYFSVWRDMHGLSDHRWSDIVRSDSIDILVDLSGHTTGSRVRAFSLRPAPVQVTWLGYPNTTGLKEMDYRLTDEISDPSGLADPYYSERLVRLGGGPWCFRPRDGTPPVSDRYASANSPLVFGSFNSVHKFNDDLLCLWSRVLKAVPSSILMLKAAAFSDVGVREMYMDKMERLGVSRGRIRFADYAETMAEHLAAYHDVDIALDSFPYAGTTTTFEALYMGVPVITRCGNNHASRVGASILSRLGRSEWIGRDDDEYVEIAKSLAMDSGLRRQNRMSLRGELEASVLMDKARFAAEFSGALRGMWREWCLR